MAILEAYAEDKVDLRNCAGLDPDQIPTELGSGDPTVRKQAARVCAACVCPGAMPNVCPSDEVRAEGFDIARDYFGAGAPGENSTGVR